MSSRLAKVNTIFFRKDDKSFLVFVSIDHSRAYNRHKFSAAEKNTWTSRRQRAILCRMKTNYIQIYGATLRQLAARLGVSHATAANYHIRGQLRDVLATGHRPKCTSYYRRQCGYTLKELAAQRGCSIYKVWQLHQRGKLSG